MTKLTPAPSRFGALLLGFITLGHALIASDLVFNYFSPTPDILALWSTSTLVKSLWVAVTALGVAAVALLYRSSVLGLLASLCVTALLYFASIGLWQDLKGTFWLAIIVNVLAAIGVWRARRLPLNSDFRPIQPMITAKDPNLTIAGRLLLGSILGYVVLATFLPKYADLAFVALWAVNFITAWFISKAAQAQGKNRVLYGLLSAIATPLSIFSYIRLRSNHIRSSLGWPN
jgi:hypothetical protein